MHPPLRVRVPHCRTPQFASYGALHCGHPPGCVPMGRNEFLLTQLVEVKNAGAKLGVPAGCTVSFPAGEDPRRGPGVFDFRDRKKR